MDPTNPGPEEYDRDDDGRTPRSRPPREILAAEFGQHTPAVARTFRLVSGDDLLTVNPVDGSELENCPPQERPGRPEKNSADERAGLDRAALPPAPPGPRPPRLPLLERDGERERLVRLLARGRSVRLTGPSGSGRTALLGLVADDCADLAPDGVIRLSGHRKTPGDLLHELCATVYRTAPHRPGPEQLLGLVREIGAVVVLDDLEFGGEALDGLLDATPECAFLMAATPGVPAPSADSLVEEVFLPGLDRAGSLELLESAAGRVLTEEESNWAGDLWFESEGLPLRFLQAAALLRQRDRLRSDADAFDEFGVFQETPVDAPFDAGDGQDVPLPSLADGVAPAALLASRLSESARETLRFAVALDGEVPHQAHLPALVDETHADAALGELVSSALVTQTGCRYRLAVDVRAQLEAAGYAEGAEERAATAAQHYSWWAGHPSVTPERVCAEADAVLAALTVLTPLTTPPADEDEEGIAVLLARRAAPAFAAGLHWGAWERALRAGAEAARLAGAVAEQAYFHHELGVLALLTGQFDRARAELETSVGLRGALADKRGTIAGRRALALVADRSGELPPVGEDTDTRHDAFVPLPAGSAPAALTAPGTADVPTLVAAHPGKRAAKTGPAGRLAGSVRRNAAAVGAGALLVAVLGTVVTLGANTDNTSEAPSEKVGVNPSASVDVDDEDLDADRAKKGPADTPRKAPKPTDPGPDGTYGTSDDPTPPASPSPSGEPTGTDRPKEPTKSPTKKPTRTPTRSPSNTPSGGTSGSPSASPSTSPSPDPSDPEPPEDSTTAGGPSEATASLEESSPEETVM